MWMWSADAVLMVGKCELSGKTGNGVSPSVRDWYGMMFGFDDLLVTK